MYEFEYLNKDRVVASVLADLQNNKVQVVRYTDSFLDNPLPRGNLNIFDLYDFIEGRCFPRSRANAKEVLASLNLTEYNPYEIVKKTHGIQWDDFYWIRFKGENLTYNDVKVRG